MKCVLCVFSPTGGTKKVAEILCSALSEHTRIIDLTDPNMDFADIALQTDEVAVVALPSYGGRAPAPAVERLKKIHGNGNSCVLLCVYGNRAYEDTLVEMQDTADGCGFKVVAAVTAVAEHSILRRYATGRPDAADKKKLQEIAEKIVRKLSGSENDDKPVLPGNHPFKKVGKVPLIPKTTSACTSCGLCADRCPVQAVNKPGFTTDKTRCIACMRCVAVCPRHARKVNGFLLAAAAVMIKKACKIRKECECRL